jgi:hypothetical protein
MTGMGFHPAGYGGARRESAPHRPDCRHRRFWSARQQPPALDRVLRCPGQAPQCRAVKTRPEFYCCTHGHVLPNSHRRVSFSPPWESPVSQPSRSLV